MKMKLKFIPVLIVLGMVGLVLLWAGRGTAASDPAETFTGVAQIEGQLQLDLRVSPPVAAPGDTVTLTVHLHNRYKVRANPALTLQLPPGLALIPAQIPAGATVNLQTNALNWLPILPANGGEGQIELAARVDTVDLTQPAQAVTAVLRYEDNEQTAAAPVWLGIPPQISRILPLPPVAVGQPVQLLADISGSGPMAQTWHLGDGRRVAVNDPIVVYPAAGEYEIQLEAANPLTSVVGNGRITIVPQPAAQFVPDDDSPGVGQQINFINQSGGQPPLIYRWDFGDGAITTEAAPGHQYAAPGTYTVHLTIENAFGQSEAFWTITVGAPPIADMEIDTYALTGEPVVGQAFGDDTVTVFRWDMGDGAVYEGELISHPYRRGGDYYVSMSAYNEHGGTEIGRWVYVEPGQLAVYLPLIMRFDGGADGSNVDTYALALDPVALDRPFVMGAMDVPAGSTPQEQLLLYINEARRRFDLPPLDLAPALSLAAQQHVNDMAGYSYAGHTGYDGSLPAERLIWQGYSAGYAGEATAWGFEYPYQAVEFWVNSPAHRRIILNQYATDVGVGYTVDFAAPNVWYWTAEFGNAFAAATQPYIRLAEPPPEWELMISEPVTFAWNWPQPLATGQQFTVYRLQEGTAVPLGIVTQPQLDTRYSLTLPASNDWSQVGQYEWQVVLEDSSGRPLLSGELRPITFAPDPNLPTPTPVVSPTAVPTVIPTDMPVTPTPTPRVLSATPRATLLPPPVVITATPAP